MNNETKYVTVDDIQRRHYITYTSNRLAWHKHLTALASAGLTILISFQQNYVLSSSIAIFLVALCWVSLALCISFGLLVIFGQAQSSLDAANNLSRIQINEGEQAAVDLLNSTNGIHFRERLIFRIAEYGLLASFLTALVSIVWFSVLNIL